MIVRIWRGREKKGHAGAYRRHLRDHVFPRLGALPGFMGACWQERELAGEAEDMVMTKWTSMEAVKSFAGPNPGRAVVEPEARAVLSGFEDVVTHHEVVAEIGPSLLSRASDQPGRERPC